MTLRNNRAMNKKLSKLEKKLEDRTYDLDYELRKAKVHISFLERQINKLIECVLNRNK